MLRCSAAQPTGAILNRPPCKSALLAQRTYPFCPPTLPRGACRWASSSSSAARAPSPAANAAAAAPAPRALAGAACEGLALSRFCQTQRRPCGGPGERRPRLAGCFPGDVNGLGSGQAACLSHVCLTAWLTNQWSAKMATLQQPSWLPWPPPHLHQHHPHATTPVSTDSSYFSPSPPPCCMYATVRLTPWVFRSSEHMCVLVLLTVPLPPTTHTPFHAHMPLAHRPCNTADSQRLVLSWRPRLLPPLPLCFA